MTRMTRNQTMTGRSRTLTGSDTSVGRGCRFTSRAGSHRPSFLRATQARPGSALILVLVCLVMMVLIGTAYVQVARVDRRATAQLTGVNNLDTVRDAVIAYIAKVLKEDIFDDAGNMFKASSFDEAYDYPFSNRDVTYAVTSGNPSTVGNPITTPAAGGRLDDTWLASTYMGSDIPSEFPYWSHVSNMNGIFLKLPKTAAAPIEQVTAATTSLQPAFNNDGFGEVYYNVATNDNLADAVFSMATSSAAQYDIKYEDASWHPMGADTDGDGILDAGWTWAPEEVRQIGSLAYVVSYRIIDLSSLVNINVATALTSNGTTLPTAAQAARASYPTDLDLSRIFAKSNKNAQWTGELGAVMTVRGLSSALPTLPGNATFNSANGLAEYSGADHRAAAWNDQNVGAKFYGYLNNRFDKDSELELRARGGLNTATVAPIENAMPTMLRRDSLATTEATYVNIPGIAAVSDPNKTNSFMNGSVTGLHQGTSLTDGARTLPEMRHFLTTINGASILAPQYGDMSSSVGSLDRLQYDLVHRNVRGTPNPTTRATEIAERLKKILKVGSPGYLGLNATQTDQIATEFAVAIQDYSDRDSEPTGLAVGGTTYYGLEIMPFLREFYVEAAYESTMPDVDPGDNTKMIYKERTYKAGSGAFIIEIGNPFDKPCDFTKIGIRVRVLKEGSGTALVEHDVTGANLVSSQLKPRDNVETTEQMIFYGTPMTPAPDANTKGANLLADLGVDTVYPADKREEITIKLPDSAITDESPLTVELQVKDSTGAYVTYDRLRHADMKLPAKYTQNHGDGTTPEIGHAQRSLRRDGQKNRYLSNRGKDVAKADASKDSYVGNGSLSKFGADSKGVTGDTNIDKIQLAHSDHQIFNVAELGYIFMYGFFVGDEGDLPSRISGKDGNKGPNTTLVATDTASLGRMFLSLTASGIGPDGSNSAIVPDSTKIPHMSMIMDQFTTLSPRWDGLDNDNDDGDDSLASSADNEQEQFVPGRLNVNTTPIWLMAMTSPLHEPTTDLEQFYMAIGEYRDRPASRPTITGITSGLPITKNTDKGIRSIGELLLIKQRAVIPTVAAAPNHSAFWYGTDNQSIPDTDAKRMYPHADDSTAKGYDEEYVAQERMTRFQYLSNTLTTRSDVFCAYVIIRGYSSTAFNQAPSESLRFFALFDRSGLIDNDSPVTVFPKTGQKN